MMTEETTKMDLAKINARMGMKRIQQLRTFIEDDCRMINDYRMIKHNLTLTAFYKETHEFASGIELMAQEIQEICEANDNTRAVFQDVTN